MFASTIHLILLLVATLWMANGKPAEPIESISGNRESRQMMQYYVPYHGPWSLPHGSFQLDYDDSLMDSVDPVSQQRWMEVLLAVSKGKQPPFHNESGYLNSTRNLNSYQSANPSVSRFASKNRGQTPSPNSDSPQQQEFLQLEARPDVQALVNQTIQTIIAAVVQAVIAQLIG